MSGGEVGFGFPERLSWCSSEVRCSNTPTSKSSEMVHIGSCITASTARTKSSRHVVATARSVGGNSGRTSTNPSAQFSTDSFCLKKEMTASLSTGSSSRSVSTLAVLVASSIASPMTVLSSSTSSACGSALASATASATRLAAIASFRNRVAASWMMSSMESTGTLSALPTSAASVEQPAIGAPRKTTHFRGALSTTSSTSPTPSLPATSSGWSTSASVSPSVRARVASTFLLCSSTIVFHKGSPGPRGGRRRVSPVYCSDSRSMVSSCRYSWSNSTTYTSRA
mmetsp:Transcript_28892/g.78835  ORF Transcript_28892/g.78835 Transcript_28892/m.78835 type:complete len:283 (+) Transcript_28892:7974-8822(+)